MANRVFGSANNRVIDTSACEGRSANGRAWKCSAPSWGRSDRGGRHRAERWTAARMKHRRSTECCCAEEARRGRCADDRVTVSRSLIASHKHAHAESPQNKQPSPAGHGVSADVSASEPRRLRSRTRLVCFCVRYCPTGCPQ